jgi:acyl-CoA synthetase (AMP-forming)/AMP-acid ligase II
VSIVGIGRNDRVAIVLANGPEMATCFMNAWPMSGVASFIAPLNPAYRADEFEFYLSDLNAKALIVEHDSSSPAIEVAQKLGVRHRSGPVPGAGRAASRCEPARWQARHASRPAGGMAEPGDVSMVLHTSGTTSRPKIVPLSQRNLRLGPNIARTLH